MLGAQFARACSRPSARVAGAHITRRQDITLRAALPLLLRTTPTRAHSRTVHTTCSLASSSPASHDASSAATSSTALSVASLSLVSELVAGVLASDRVALSRAITLVESGHPLHLAQASEMMRRLADHRRSGQGARDQQELEANRLLAAMPADKRAEASLSKPRAMRIGFSGPPGVGKSTFIECFGQYLLSLGHRLAVLSIDPSSHVSGGSILGDKTRMLELSRSPDAFVRPSPSRCVLGGVGANTFDAILLCESAGFDLVFVETVGVGQSEVSVNDMVDMLVMLVQPGGGDELQGMKKGIVELIDLIIVNKADGPLIANARHTKLEYMHALQLNTRRKKETDWKPLVKLCSSVSGSSVAQTDYSTPGEAAPPEQQQEQIRDIWKTIGAFEDWSKGPLGDFALRRSRQSKALLHQALQDAVTHRLTRALDDLPAYQRLESVWSAAEQQARIQNAAAPTRAAAAALPTVAPSHEAELVPRVEAQRIVDEWLARQNVPRA